MTKDEALQRFNFEFKRLFGFPLDSRAGFQDHQAKELNWKDYMIPSNNGFFKESPYYFKKREMIHFTKLESLFKIAESKGIRLFNLNNLDDPREFSYASRVFNIDDDEIKSSKIGQYIISCCETSILTKSRFEEQFNMWRLYGDNGKGVGIVLSIENDRNKWEDFHLSPIQYGVDGRTKFADIIKILNQINRDSEILNVDLGKLYSFHKSKLYQGEQEVRLLWDDRQNGKKLHGTITKTINGKKTWPVIGEHPDKKDVNYLSLPITITEKDEFMPDLKIEEVILGYNYNDNELLKNTDSIKETFRRYLNYEPKVSRTELYSEYADINAKIFPFIKK